MKKNAQLNQSKKNLNEYDIDTLLEEISVLEEWENQTKELERWFAVASDLGIIAYFCNRPDALRYRLDYINRIMND